MDVQSGNSVALGNSLGFDFSNLDFSLDSGLDLTSLFGFGDSTISNQRGAELYRTASTRCKASVLDTCRNQGVDTNLISDSYDLEIDKKCIAYERDLTNANTEMSNTVRNAKSVLQKARLVVAQQKNQYDLRGCVNALDTCMQDEFVCGTDYQDCLDPTGRYIVGGNVITGSQPGIPGGATGGLYGAWGTAWTDAGGINGYINSNFGKPQTSTATVNMVNYLEQKIGYYNDTEGKNYGMCMSVLNKCQNFTYTNQGTYNLKNEVVLGFLQRILTQIKSAQDNTLAEYAENCISEVSSCLAQNGWTSTADTFVKNVAQNACKSLITTCASVVNAGNTSTEDTEQAIIDAATGDSHMRVDNTCTTVSPVDTSAGCARLGYRCEPGYKTPAIATCVKV